MKMRTASVPSHSSKQLTWVMQTPTHLRGNSPYRRCTSGVSDEPWTKKTKSSHGPDRDGGDHARVPSLSPYHGLCFYCGLSPSRDDDLGCGLVSSWTMTTMAATSCASISARDGDDEHPSPSMNQRTSATSTLNAKSPSPIPSPRMNQKTMIQTMTTSLNQTRTMEPILKTKNGVYDASSMMQLKACVDETTMTVQSKA